MRARTIAVLLVGFGLVLSGRSQARWERKCEEVTETRQVSPGVWLPSTTTKCRKVWVPDTADSPDMADTIRLLREWLKLCKEMGGTQEQCNEALVKAVGQATQH